MFRTGENPRKPNVLHGTWCVVQQLQVSAPLIESRPLHQSA
jgi:hypothetical protein